uniref:Kelch-like protein 10 n=1 Tax=Sinocyclocheilus rhinocerous TaxID=307959 RepID=A0A673GGV3_9TELE
MMLYVLQHFEEVLQVSEEFLELPLGHLEAMIAQDELNVKQEEMVFEAIVRWIGHAPENRRKHIAVLLSKVRMGLMSPDYFMTDVRNNALVLESEACSDIVINAMKVIFDLHMEEPASSELVNQLTRPRLPYEILLAIGGWSVSNPTNEIEAYDARADCWVNVAPMYERRCYVSVAVLDGLIYAIGGFNGYGRLKTAYNPLNDTWHDIRSMINPRSNFGIEVTSNVNSAEIAVFEVSH